MYQEEFAYGPEIDSAEVPFRIAHCLREVKANDVRIVDNRVTFRGRMFWSNGGRHVLSAFACGEVEVHPERRIVSYRLDYQESVQIAGAITVLFAIIAFMVFDWTVLAVVPAWVILLILSYVRSFSRFRKFLNEVIESSATPEAERRITSTYS